MVAGLTLSTAQRWFLRAGLFVLPLAYWPGTFDQNVLPKMLVARVLVIGLASLLVARLVVTRSVTIKRTPLDIPWAVFIGSALVSTAFAYNQNVALFGIYLRYDGLFTIVTYAALFWLAVQTIDGPGEARSIFRVLLASGYVVSAVAIVQSVNDSLAVGYVEPALGTLGNTNVLGAFLAMLGPLAFLELIEARTRTGRILAANALVLIGLALLLTFSRSSWLGAAAAIVVLAAGGRSAAARLGVAGAAMLVVGVVLVAGLRMVGGLGLEHVLELRARTVFDISSWQFSRLHIWRDSLSVVASRPLLGYGPDNFGLIFPTFQTGNWSPDSGGLGQAIDKAHAETLQVTATQGLVGLASYSFMLIAFLRAFWRGRAQPGSVPILAAWLAYQVTVQLNFSTPAASFPFWIFAAAAIESWSIERSARTARIPNARFATGGGVAAVAALGALAWLSVFCPFIADAQLLRAVNSDFAGRSDLAAEPASQARVFGPFESVYAVEAGNLAFEQQDWDRARAAFAVAARLGTYNPAVYRNLALADQHLGRSSEARAAAQRAVELDRFDPANRALLAQFGN